MSDKEMGTLQSFVVHPPVDINKMSSDEKLSFGYDLENGLGVYEQDYELARMVYLAAAGEGNERALNNIGLLYLNGYGVEADSDKAQELFLQAADKGCMAAMVNLGDLAEEVKDYERAYRWYQAAYILGDVNGKFNYARLYHHGWFVEQDYSFAFRLFNELAIKDHDPRALSYLGLYFQNGYGVEANEEMAFRSYLHGAEQGQRFCIHQLAECYAKGIGVEKDVSRAVWLLENAGKSGDSYAWRTLGGAYENGDGVNKSLYLAVDYYSKGAALGDEFCMDAVKRLADPEKSDEEIYLGHIDDIDKELTPLVRKLMEFANRMGLKTGFINGPLGVFTSPVFNAAPRNRGAGEYVRLEHKISKLSVKKRMSEKRVEELFTGLKEEFLLSDKQLSVKRGYVYIEATILKDEKLFRRYLEIIREIGRAHLPSGAKVVGVEEYLRSYEGA